MSWPDVLVIFLGGLFAGFVNAMAGGGSLLTVPLLSIAGVEGTMANGTNRVAVLVQNLSSFWGYVRRGVWRRGAAISVVVPAGVGALFGSLLASQFSDELFERIFGLLMIPVLFLTIRSGKESTDRPGKPSSPDGPAGSDIDDGGVTRLAWSLPTVVAVFFLVGIYGGAIQAGVGLFLLLTLAGAGFDLVEANAMKALVIIVMASIAVPVFVATGQVRWLAAVILSAGMGAGGFLGANVAVEGGERLIRPVLVVVVVVLATRMLGLWSLL